MNTNHDIKTKFKVGGTSFLVRILCRQNTSLQGEIHWLNGEKKMFFRSLLEMVMLMQEAVEASGVPIVEYRFRSWEDEDQQIDIIY